MLEQLYSAKAITREVLRYGTTQHVSYRVNQSALEEFSAEKRAAARSSGEPEFDLIGIDLLTRVKTPTGSTLNSIWFYQVPLSKTYLLVVTGYEPNDVDGKAFCGSLSLYCPNIFDPQETTVVTRCAILTRTCARTQTLSDTHLHTHALTPAARDLHCLSVAVSFFESSKDQGLKMPK